MQIIIKNKDTLLYNKLKFKCSIGKNGTTLKKTEGDKKTPKGTFSIGSLYFRKDRISKPQTQLKIVQIKKNFGWCDDPKSKFYNRLIKIPNQVSHEKLFQKSNHYDLLIPIKYNFFKPKKNKGSAIFIHLTSTYKKTLGCIALKKKDLLMLLKFLNKNTKIKIL